MTRELMATFVRSCPVPGDLITCRAQKLVRQQLGKYGVTRRAQVPQRSFDKLAGRETSLRRLELFDPASGVGRQRL
jgi:hypothetical protein